MKIEKVEKSNDATDKENTGKFLHDLFATLVFVLHSVSGDDT